MSCVSNDDVRIISKYSTISGVIPTIPPSADHMDGTWLPTDLYISELFLNSVDNKVWIRTDLGIFEIGSATGSSSSFIGDYVPTSGGTYSGCVYIPCLTTDSILVDVLNISGTASGTFSGSFIGDGSGLTGINANWLGGTVSNPVYFTNTIDISNTINLSGPIIGDVNITGGVELTGGVSASIFYGDGSGLTNLPTGTFSDVYTTNASLSGNSVIFDRNDLTQYEVDLTPILASQSISTITWDSSINTLYTLLSDDTLLSTIIDSFSDITAMGSVTAPEFYGGDFYGNFIGTFSGNTDIYSTTASVVNNELIIQRNDGLTFSTTLPTSASNIISLTYSTLFNLKLNNLLVPNTTYKITDAVSWWPYWNHITNKVVYIKALSTNQLTTNGNYEQVILKNQAYLDYSVWNESNPYIIGDKVIWGGRIWTNGNGNTGDYIDDGSLDTLSWELDSTNINLYTKTFQCVYEFDVDTITSVIDDRGNHITESEGSYYMITDWGDDLIKNNKSSGIFNNNNCDIYDNLVNGYIKNNINCNINNNIITNHISDNNEGNISRNQSHRIYNNSISLIRYNRVYSIYDNSNTGDIYNNIGKGIFENSNLGDISDNNCSTIRNNTNLGNIIQNTSYIIQYCDNEGHIKSNTVTGELGIYNLTDDTGDVINNIAEYITTAI